MQDLNEEYEAALERRRLEVEAERHMQEEEDAKLLRALTAQQELPGDDACPSAWRALRQACAGVQLALCSSGSSFVGCVGGVRPKAAG